MSGLQNAQLLSTEVHLICDGMPPRGDISAYRSCSQRSRLPQRKHTFDEPSSRSAKAMTVHVAILRPYINARPVLES
jgi:hypothetical protein